MLIVLQALQFFDVHLSIYIVMLIFITPMWLSSLITNLKYLAPVSTFANAILFTAIVITLYYICVGVKEFSSLRYVAGIDTIPLFLAVALYSYDSVALLVPLRNEMDNPEKMVGPLGVLNMGFLIVIPIITSLGFFSYFKYGEEIRGTIFLNLPEDDKLVQALLILVCIQVLFSYPVQLYVPVTILWPMVVERYGPFKHNLRNLLCFRT
ncbi:Amino acid transporter, partial [Oryctes borbonicus]